MNYFKQYIRTKPFSIVNSQLDKEGSIRKSKDTGDYMVFLSGGWIKVSKKRVAELLVQKQLTETK